MNDVRPMSGREGQTDLPGIVERLPARKSDEELPQGLALDIFADYVLQRALIGKCIDGEDVGLIESGGRKSFAPQPFNVIGPAGEARSQELQRHQTVQALFAGQIDLAHSAPAQAFHDLIQATYQFAFSVGRFSLIPFGKRIQSAQTVVVFTVMTEQRTDFHINGRVVFAGAGQKLFPGGSVPGESRVEKLLNPLWACLCHFPRRLPCAYRSMTGRRSSSESLY